MSVQYMRLLAASLIVCRTWASLPPLNTAPAQLLPRKALSASDSDPSCSALSSLYASCEAATPGFATINPNTQVSCLCYSSSVLVPTIYDQALGSCISYYQTADPAALTSASIAQILTMTDLGRTWTTPCAEYSAYQSVQSLTSDARISACYSWEAIVSSCNQSTPGFTTLSLSTQASCACYLSGGTTYAPLVYDGYLDACLDYYSANEPQYYSQIHGDQILRTPCVMVGNIKSGVPATGAQASASIPTQTSAMTTEVLTTTQPKASAAANWAPGGGHAQGWLLALSALPLVFMLFT